MEVNHDAPDPDEDGAIPPAEKLAKVCVSQPLRESVSL